jgi:segregation and condensation protein A
VASGLSPLCNAGLGILIEVASFPWNIQLEQYEGPLDLLLDLIRKQQINISDIPIAQITAQYLDFMQKAMEMDIELGAEFVYMAATLIHIKSKMLLPRDPELDKILPEEDPRTELVHRLLEHERFKNAAEMLQQKRMIEEAVWSNPQIRQFADEDENPGLAITLFDLVQTFQKVLDRAKDRPVYEIGKEDVTVPDMIRYLRSILESEPGGKAISVTQLFERQKSRRSMICLFLALLEMVKLGAISLTQAEAFDDIGIKKSKNYASALESADVLEALEQGYN